MARWCWVNFQCWCIVLFWIRVGQGPSALAVGAGGNVWIFLLSYIWGGAKVLGKLPVPGRPANLDKNRARTYCACSRCGWGLIGHFFFSSITSRFFLPLSGKRPEID